MGTRVVKAAFLLVAVAFFAVLALDIAVPAVVLCTMAATNWIVLNGVSPLEWKGKTA